MRQEERTGISAKNVKADPLARVLLPYRQGFSFHGSFVPVEQLKQAI